MHEVLHGPWLPLWQYQQAWHQAVYKDAVGYNLPKSIVWVALPVFCARHFAGTTAAKVNISGCGLHQCVPLYHSTVCCQEGLTPSDSTVNGDYFLQSAFNPVLIS